MASRLLIKSYRPRGANWEGEKNGKENPEEVQEAPVDQAFDAALVLRGAVQLERLIDLGIRGRLEARRPCFFVRPPALSPQLPITVLRGQIENWNEAEKDQKHAKKTQEARGN
jgi:hypothetical protein